MVLHSPVSGVPKVRLSSRETAPEKRSPISAFLPGWEAGFIGGRKSKPPSGKKRQPMGLRLEASIWKEWVSISKRRLPDLLRRQKFQRQGRGS